MIERKIVIGMITSTEYLQQIKNSYDPLLLESVTAKKIAGWCWSYFEQYKTCPGKQIESIFFEQAKKLSKDIAEEIEQEILPSLSSEYANESFNLSYLLDSTNKYFKERRLLSFTDSIQSLLSVDDITEAEKIASDYKRSVNSSGTDLDKFILSTAQISRKNTPHPRTLLKPWLKEGELTIIYGDYGSGKSLLTISIAYVLGLENYDNEDADIGEWQVKHPTGTLYIDGELGEKEMEQRINQFNWLGRQSQDHRMKIFSVPEYQLETEDSFSLSDRKNQHKLINWLREHQSYKLIVLDSVSTLFGLVEENDNSEWSNKINPFLRDLRALGVACLLLHHSGKNNKKGLRGASSMGAMAHNIYRLTNHGEKNIDDGEAWFVLSKDKQRAAGTSFRKFALKYTQNIEKTETNWEIT